MKDDPLIPTSSEFINGCSIFGVIYNLFPIIFPARRSFLNFDAFKLQFVTAIPPFSSDSSCVVNIFPALGMAYSHVKKAKKISLCMLMIQKMNAYLKEIADLCGLNKKLTTHAARHTFATTVTLSNQVSMESVSKMLGQTSISMSRKYAA